MDLKIEAGDWTGRDTLNYTLAQEILTKADEKFSYATPRLFLDNVAMISNQDCESSSFDPSDRSWKVSYLFLMCSICQTADHPVVLERNVSTKFVQRI